MKRTPDICNRLRGIYRIPITDGLGAVGSGDEPNNPEEFVRSFPSSPIMREAADSIEELLSCLEHAVHWHDQLTKDDIARYQAVISKAKGG